MNGPGRDVRLDGRGALSTADFDLLWELACHAGQILGREALFRNLRGATTTARIAAWTWPSPVCAAGSRDDSNNPTRIKTVRQKGYLLVPQAWE